MNSTFLTKTLLLLVTLAQVGQLYAQRTAADFHRPTFDSSQVVMAIIDTLPAVSEPMTPMVAQPSGVAGYALDKSKVVGDVPYELGTTAAGQVELTIPVATFATEHELAPQVALTYNSQGGLTCMGQSWDIAGLSCIEPVSRNYFTDRNTSGRSRSDGPWALDGNRLILQEANDTAQVFLTQTGNIKVVHHLNGTGGFTAFLPNGTVNRYGVSSGDGIRWYLTSCTALDGRTVSYTYYDDYYSKLVKSVGYGEERTLDFAYEQADNERSAYIDGVKTVFRQKLSRVDVCRQGRLLRRYAVTYRDGDIAAPPSRVDMSDSVGNAVNPLQLHYRGDYAHAGALDHSMKALVAYFNFSDPNELIAFRGKLDIETENDALIVYPYKDNYIKKGYHRVVNMYNKDDEITINNKLGNTSQTYLTRLKWVAALLMRSAWTLMETMRRNWSKSTKTSRSPGASIWTTSPLTYSRKEPVVLKTSRRVIYT